MIINFWTISLMPEKGPIWSPTSSLSLANFNAMLAFLMVSVEEGACAVVPGLFLHGV